MTSRVKSIYRCSACGHTAPRWSGRCSGCDAWNTVVEGREADTRRREIPGSGERVGPVPLHDLSSSTSTIRSTGVGEVDRVLSGGLAAGSVTLLSGPPGIGKSTLAIQIASGLACRDESPVVYVAAEETTAQIRGRADRLSLAMPHSLQVHDSTDVDDLIETIESRSPYALIVDSVQTIFDPSIDSSPGSVTQVRTCAQRLARTARATGTILLLIGHVTKDGSIAGPRLLEHLVDSVVSFDRDGSGNLRLLRATKHRFGPTGNLGVFAMNNGGLVGIDDAAGLFLSDRRTGVCGSVVTPISEGRRILLAEVQALVRKRTGGGDHRLCQGLDAKRVDLVLAVLEQHTGIVGDAYVSIAGGISTKEPAVDLAVVVAVVSAASGVPVDPNLVVCGEVGLVGELRRVPALDQRLAEARRLGFTRALVPAGCELSEAVGLSLEQVGDLTSALDRALGVAAPTPIRSPREAVGLSLGQGEWPGFSASGGVRGQ